MCAPEFLADVPPPSWRTPGEPGSPPAEADAATPPTGVGATTETLAPLLRRKLSTGVVITTDGTST